jgi:ferredoxin
MLVDLCLALKPGFNLMDGIVGMEGPGPGGGTPREIGLVLASRDCLALDRTASRIIGYDPSDIYYLEDALTRKAWIESDSEIEIRGESLESAKLSDWKAIPRVSDSVRAKFSLPGPLRNLFVPRPFFSHEKCVACSGCVTICPAKALKFEKDQKGRKFVAVDYAACIRCYCCHEVCPEKAVFVRTRRPRAAELRKGNT